MARKLSHNPVCILMKEAVLTFDSVRQLYVNVAKDKDKINKIFDFYNIMASKQAIVFCGARRAAEFIAQKLQADHRPATVIVSTHACI
jgi:translation initiation factor 4A